MEAELALEPRDSIIRCKHLKWQLNPCTKHLLLHVYFTEMSTQIIYPFFFLAVDFEFLRCFGYQPPVRCVVCKYFLPFHRLALHLDDYFLCLAEVFKLKEVQFIHIYLSRTSKIIQFKQKTEAKVE